MFVLIDTSPRSDTLPPTVPDTSLTPNHTPLFSDYKMISHKNSCKERVYDLIASQPFSPISSFSPFVWGKVTRIEPVPSTSVRMQILPSVFSPARRDCHKSAGKVLGRNPRGSRCCPQATLKVAIPAAPSVLYRPTGWQ